MDFDVREFDDFRAEVEAWAKQQFPESDGFGPKFQGDARRRGEYSKVTLATQQALGERGWLCAAWPAEYGGQAWPKLKQAVFNEIAAYRRIPGTGNANLGVSTVGPTIMIYGSEEHKQKYLPMIAHGDLMWSQGYSEPNAGSDLASLQTKAVADGDDYVINGAKIWNHSTSANILFLLARTDQDAPKHKGISQFIIPLGKGQPDGITVQPIHDANNQEHWTLLTLEDVRVPRSALLGEVNRGWYQTATSLDFERSQMAWIGNSQRQLETLLDYARTKTRGGKRLIDDIFIRDYLGDLAVQLEMARWLSYRIAYLQDQGKVPNAEASMSKLWATEVLQKLQRAGANIIGPLGHLRHGSEFAEHNGDFDEDYWHAPGTTLAGGASEIQRNIIAQRGLGLPR